MARERFPGESDHRVVREALLDVPGIKNVTHAIRGGPEQEHVLALTLSSGETVTIKAKNLVLKLEDD